ncbi:pyridoxal phosphate-dependent transferase [Xylariaceae sp. AK1471]|nr:pyridoxal phosphate-dependent transferase [Xylariaceae sp. AK1471]
MDYIITGGWSQKAAAEAERLFGSEHVNTVADSRKTNNGKFGTIPDESTWNLSERAALVYYCDNETVDGVEFPGFPNCLEPGPDGLIFVADMSLNILSRKIPIENFSAIFFGAQKNLGLTGITVVVIKKSFLPPATSQLSATLMRQLGLPIPPRIFEYEIIAKNNSLYNTLRIFDVYVAGQVLKKLLLQPPNKVIINKTVRSRMNICFRIKGCNTAKEAFLAERAAQGLTGLKGHRSVRGIPVSNYNAIPLDSAEKLANFIDHFASQRDKSVR